MQRKQFSTGLPRLDHYTGGLGPGDSLLSIVQSGNARYPERGGIGLSRFYALPGRAVLFSDCTAAQVRAGELNSIPVRTEGAPEAAAKSARGPGSARGNVDETLHGGKASGSARLRGLLPAIGGGDGTLWS